MDYSFGYSAYRDTGVKTASQGKLVVMLYDGMIRQLDAAIKCFGETEDIGPSEIENLNTHIVKTQEILTELRSEAQIRIFYEERVVAFDERALRTAQDRIDSRERADRLERSFQICKRNRIQKKIDAAEGDPRTVFTQKEDLFPERSEVSEQIEILSPAGHGETDPVFRESADRLRIDRRKFSRAVQQRSIHIRRNQPDHLCFSS